MYFCKNCGEPYMTDEAVMCVKCGVAKGQGNNYCHNCGKPLAPDAAVCLNCGVANKQAPAPDAKSKLVAGLLAIFLGTFGVHNFYLGYTGKAVTQLVHWFLCSPAAVQELLQLPEAVHLRYNPDNCSQAVLLPGSPVQFLLRSLLLLQ